MRYATPLETAYIINTPLLPQAVKNDDAGSIPGTDAKNPVVTPTPASETTNEQPAPSQTSDGNIGDDNSHVASPGEVGFSVETGYPADVSQISGTEKFQAQMQGTVVDGGSDGISAWVEYGKNGTFERSTLKSNTFSGSRDFGRYVTDLENDTTYTFRAVAQKGDSITYGDVHTFTIGNK